MTSRDVAETVRRMMLDHVAGKLGLLGAPSARPVGLMSGDLEPEHRHYFEITLEGKTFLVCVQESSE